MKISEYTPKVGDKVKVVGDSYYLGANYTGVVTRVFEDLFPFPFIVREENDIVRWNDLSNKGEIYLMEKKLDNLEVGDVVVNGGRVERTILGISGLVCHLSGVLDSKYYSTSYSIEDLKKLGYTVKNNSQDKEEWLKKGEDNGWVKKGKVVE